MLGDRHIDRHVSDVNRRELRQINMEKREMKIGRIVCMLEELGEHCSRALTVARCLTGGMQSVRQGWRKFCGMLDVKIHS